MSVASLNRAHLFTWFFAYQLFRSFVYAYSLFFFKQKTAYEMRISDWSSDVCSSDLLWHVGQAPLGRVVHLQGGAAPDAGAAGVGLDQAQQGTGQSGLAGAVAADQAAHGARFELQRHVVERGLAVVPLVQAVGGHRRGRGVDAGVRRGAVEIGRAHV